VENDAKPINHYIADNVAHKNDGNYEFTTVM